MNFETTDIKNDPFFRIAKKINIGKYSALHDIKLEYQ